MLEKNFYLFQLEKKPNFYKKCSPYTDDDFGKNYKNNLQFWTIFFNVFDSLFGKPSLLFGGYAIHLFSMFRDANSPAIFTPRGSGKLKHIPLVSGLGSGNFGEYFVSDMKSSCNLLKRIFFIDFFLNQKTNMIFMIRNDKIAGNWRSQY